MPDHVSGAENGAERA